MDLVTKTSRALDRLSRKASRPHRLARPYSSLEEANALIAREIRSGRPLMVARLGATEQAVFRRYMLVKRWPLAERWSAVAFGSSLKRTLRDNAGVFPPSGRSLESFSAIYDNALAQVDLFAVWGNRGEAAIVHKHLGESARLVPLGSLTPLFDSPKSWIGALENKVVLVVHPFAATIRSQVPRLNEIFPSRLWPHCEIKVLQAEQTIGGRSERFESWFDALNCMSREVQDSAANVVLIGAGAYGLPLAAAAKASGKTALLVGGSLQLLFGIRGRRWDGSSAMKEMMNSSWVRPGEDERPAAADRVEGGCYW